MVRTLFTILLLFGAVMLASNCSSHDSSKKLDGAASKMKAQSKPVHPGKKIFKTHCITCHGIDGTLGVNGAKNLKLSELNRQERIDVITNGRKLMTPFKGILTDEEINKVAAYTLTLAAK